MVFEFHHAVVLFNFIMWWCYSILLCGCCSLTFLFYLISLCGGFIQFHYVVVLFNFIMRWFYLISLCGSFDAAHWVFLSVPLSFINRQANFSLKVNRNVGHKSEMEDILNLYRKK